MAKDTNRVPPLASRILNSKSGATSSPQARNTRARGGQSSNRTSTNSRGLSSSAQASRGRPTSQHPPTTANLRKTGSTTKKTTAKDKRQAAVAAAEENAARLNASSWDDEDEGDEAADIQGGTHCPFGADNSRDVFDNGHEDENDSEDGSEAPEASRRPHLTRGLSVDDDEDIEDLEDDGIAGLDNYDSDFDDPANSPAHHGRRKDKSTGIKFIPVGTTTTITSKLPAKKVNKRQASDQSSEGVRSPVRTGTVTASSSPRSIRGTTLASSPRTPRKSIINTIRPRIMDQTPATQGLLKAASSDTRQELAVRDAFPQRAVFTEQSKATFLAACNDAQAIVQRQRFLKSDSYRVRVLSILRQKLPQMRQEVRNAALAKTAIHYGITSTMKPADIVECVNRLKTKFAYVFGDPNQKKAPYGNPIFQILINTLYFEGKRKSEAISNPAPWNPMPLPVLALMATAIHSVLDDWSTGINEAAKNPFTHDKYAPVYRDHLANLARFNEKAPAAVAKLRTSLWENAWSSTGCPFPDQGNVNIDDDVFAEAEAEALA